MKKIYILLSYSGSFPAQVIKMVTKKKYAHSSISLNSDLSPLYSFGRKKMNNFLNGGFVIEKIGEGIFKKFPDTYGEVLELEISDEGYQKIEEKINEYVSEKDKYKYAILGASLCYFGIENNKKYKSYCSDFVAKILKCGGVDLSNLPKSPKPFDFLKLNGAKSVYFGKVNDYKGA